MPNANAESPPPPASYRDPLSVGTLRLASRFNLAPLAGYTNLPFRLSVRELGGVGLCTSDLVNARAVLEGIKKTMELLATDPGERPLFVQIFGGRAEALAGVAAVTIHGRTREQGFSGGVNHDGIRRVVEAVERIPVFGNGDVRTVADAARMIAETGCHGIAIGRGALADPWIFRQLANWVS